MTPAGSGAGPVSVGVDLGTSGCRAIAIDAAGEPLAERRVALPAPESPREGWHQQDPVCWWRAVREVLGALVADLAGRPVAGVAVDGTSATLLLAAPDGQPLTPALMYNDRRSVAAAERIAHCAPPESAARGPGSSLAKLLYLADSADPLPPCIALHQADWIAARLTGRVGASDWNNALKLGFDPQGLAWPDWVRALVPSGVSLPRVLPPGAPIAPMDPGVAKSLGLAGDIRVLAGTTDSTAATLAAGAVEPGDAVTCLGTTLVLKVVSERPVVCAARGVYSHRVGELWHVGGASNSGGGVLARYFSAAELAALSAGIDPGAPSGLDYYPLPSVGERFPRADPALAPRLAPIPDDPVHFLHGLLEGIARIEAEGYRLLESLGAPRPRRILTTGGGASNDTWTAIRERLTGVRIKRADHQEAAFGTALLVRQGLSGGPRGG